ncbi:hypothetical protein HK101_008058, partial [Irineochytrium annulatum]
AEEKSKKRDEQKEKAAEIVSKSEEAEEKTETKVEIAETSEEEKADGEETKVEEEVVVAKDVIPEAKMVTEVSKGGDAVEADGVPVVVVPGDGGDAIEADGVPVVVVPAEPSSETKDEACVIEEEKTADMTGDDVRRISSDAKAESPAKLAEVEKGEAKQREESEEIHGKLANDAESEGHDKWEKAPEPYRIIMLGLDGAGKTTILFKLKFPGQSITVFSTDGFNVETTVCKGMPLTIWDIGGRGTHRAHKTWRTVCPVVDAIIFVVDSSDATRLKEARDELETLLNIEELQEVPLLVLANKQDVPGAETTEGISDRLGLRRSTLSQRPWNILATSATSGGAGGGLCEGLEWLISVLKEKSRP